MYAHRCGEREWLPYQSKTSVSQLHLQQNQSGNMALKKVKCITEFERKGNVNNIIGSITEQGLQTRICCWKKKTKSENIKNKFPAFCKHKRRSPILFQKVERFVGLD